MHLGGDVQQQKNAYDGHDGHALALRLLVDLQLLQGDKCPLLRCLQVKGLEEEMCHFGGSRISSEQGGHDVDRSE